MDPRLGLRMEVATKTARPSDDITVMKNVYAVFSRVLSCLLADFPNKDASPLIRFEHNADAARAYQRSQVEAIQMQER